MEANSSALPIGGIVASDPEIFHTRAEGAFTAMHIAALNSSFSILDAYCGGSLLQSKDYLRGHVNERFNNPTMPKSWLGRRRGMFDSENFDSQKCSGYS